MWNETIVRLCQGFYEDIILLIGSVSQNGYSHVTRIMKHWGDDFHL